MRRIYAVAVIILFLTVVLLAGCQERNNMLNGSQLYAPQGDSPHHLEEESDFTQNSECDARHEIYITQKCDVEPELEELDNYIVIRGIQYSTSLTSLFLNHFGGHYGLNDEDLIKLQYMPNLETLVLRSEFIRDISPLANLKNLSELHISYAYIIDLTPIASLTNLGILSINESNINDIAPIATLTNIWRLELMFNNITDITPLSCLTNLTTLSLSFNEISDISPLSYLTNLSYLALEFNPITDWSPVSHVENVGGRDN